jgi:hypothetical protein
MLLDMINSHDEKPVWQYSIGTLMLLVTIAALVMASLQYAVTVEIAVAGIVILFIAAHIFGNKFGTYLRNKAASKSRADQLPTHARPLHAKEKIEHGTRLSKLRERTKLDRRVAYVVAGGAVVGLLLGGVAFWNFQENGTLMSWLLGTISAAVISGIVSFVFISFLTTFYRAWRDATKD